jgi:hypothetical protein
MAKSKKDGIDYDSLALSDATSGAEFEYESIQKITDKAVLLVVDGDEQWIPKSQIIEINKNIVELTHFIANQIGWN